MDAQKVVLDLEQVTFTFKKNQDLLKRISFKCYEGDIIGFIGNNGAGKTTLGRLIAGIYKEKSGSISFYDKKTAHKKRKNKVAFVMQDADYQLFTESVEKELLIGNEAISSIEKKVEHALKEMDLLDLKERHPATLSGGQKQRVTIGLSIVKEACVVITDEPTSGLDRINMERVCSVVESLARLGKTVILITHDHEFMTRVCTRIIYLKKGHIYKDFDLHKETGKMLVDCLEDMNTN